MDTPAIALLEITSALERAGISYVVVGSLASSMHGMFRSTADVDLVVDLSPALIEPLLEQLQDRFYLDAVGIKQAVARRSSFNLIHFDSVFKVDIFIPKADEFSWQQLRNRQLRPFGPDATVYVSTAEDMTIAKLIWYRSGNEASEVQWRDVIAILRSRRMDIDINYMKTWAETFSVSDLLDRAIKESTSSSK
jgi:predicted nucleotidyltransferase